MKKPKQQEIGEIATAPSVAEAPVQTTLDDAVEAALAVAEAAARADEEAVVERFRPLFAPYVSKLQAAVDALMELVASTAATRKRLGRYDWNELARRFELPDVGGFTDRMQELEALTVGVGNAPAALAETTQTLRRLKALSYQDVRFGSKTLLERVESCLAMPNRIAYLHGLLTEEEARHAARIARQGRPVAS
jgi:hypothetical protein